MAPPLEHIPQEVATPGGSRKVWITLVGTLVCCILVNMLAKGALDRYTTNKGYWLISAKWSLLKSLDHPVDVLILGDSSCNQGLRPSVLDARLGTRSVNLCTIGNLLVVNDAWMLDTYIERFGPPKTVVLMHVYDVWYRSASSLVKGPLLAKIPLSWGFWDRLEPPISIKTTDQRDIFLARYLPIYAENKTLGSWIRSPTTSFRSHFAIDAQGYMSVTEANAKGVRKDAQGHLAFVRNRKFAMSKVNRDALRHIQQVAKARGFDVYLASAPMFEEVWANPDLQTYYAAVLQSLQTFTKEGERMHIALENPETFPAEQMENADHLTDEAAVVLTNRLADALTR